MDHCLSIRSNPETTKCSGGLVNLDDADKRENRAPSTNQTIKSLNEQLSDASFKSSTRLLIIILLAMNKKMTASELRALVGLGKGSLENHLEKLEAAGLIRMRHVQTWRGMRQNVEITEKGLEECRSLLQKIHSLNV